MLLSTRCKLLSNLELHVLTKIIIISLATTQFLIQNSNANYATSETSNNNNGLTNNFAGQATMLNLLLAPAYNNAPLNKTIEVALEQLAPDLRQLRDFTLTTTNNNQIDDATSLKLSLEAWKLMHNQAKQAVSSRLSLLEPIIIEFLNEVRVSQQCLVASKRTLEAAKNLDSWAIQRKYIGHFASKLLIDKFGNQFLQILQIL